MIPKFRAWLKSIEEMVEVLEIDFYNKEVAYIWTEQVSDYELEQTREVDKIDDLVLMQSTGLKDKNGVEIFEGDIVHWMTEFTSPMDMRTKRKIDSNKEVYQKESGEWGMGEVGNTLSEEQLNVEVIGNIYENPELLEVAE
ncbi:hypothetical protein HYO62_00335 [Aerococcaceae bacterium DSM 111022]|nr:hypothetical protein [Aerococcaceae bacterium DSM 111022]